MLENISSVPSPAYSATLAYWSSRSAMSLSLFAPASSWAIRRSSSDGTIPTCVGKTGGVITTKQNRGDHPHVRGENLERRVMHRNSSGPSPRAWGKLFPAGRTAARCRTIPTCVGKTTIKNNVIDGDSDHPHVRGENCAANEASFNETGPSPRAWGKHEVCHPPEVVGRTIPTCVGKTIAHREAEIVHADHPHVRGENVVAAVSTKSPNGPSPRAWGKRARLSPPGEEVRTIPTCVGKTALPRIRYTWRRDHPHVRGENGLPGAGSACSAGPSPRAWGKPRKVHAQEMFMRTIPTCVGKTPTSCRFSENSNPSLVGLQRCSCQRPERNSGSDTARQRRTGTGIAIP